MKSKKVPIELMRLFDIYFVLMGGKIFTAMVLELTETKGIDLEKWEEDDDDSIVPAEEAAKFLDSLKLENVIRSVKPKICVVHPDKLSIEEIHSPERHEFFQTKADLVESLLA